MFLLLWYHYRFLIFFAEILATNTSNRVLWNINMFVNITLKNGCHSSTLKAHLETFEKFSPQKHTKIFWTNDSSKKLTRHFFPSNSPDLPDYNPPQTAPSKSLSQKSTAFYFQKLVISKWQYWHARSIRDEQNEPRLPGGKPRHEPEEMRANCATCSCNLRRRVRERVERFIDRRPGRVY